MTLPTVFRAATAALALHVADDRFIHPQPGTSAGDHLVSGLVPLALLALAFWAFPRLKAGAAGPAGRDARALRGRRRGRGRVLHAEARPGGRRLHGPARLARGAAPVRRSAPCVLDVAPATAAIAPGATAAARCSSSPGVVGLIVVVVPVGAAWVFTHTARAVVPADRLGVAHEDVTLHDRATGWSSRAGTSRRATAPR